MGEVSLASRAKRGNQGGVHRRERRAFCENDLCGVQYLEEGLSALGHRRCCKGMMVYRLRLMKVFVVMVVCLWCWQCSAPRYPAGVREALAAAGENREELEQVLAPGALHGRREDARQPAPAD